MRPLSLVEVNSKFACGVVRDRMVRVWEAKGLLDGMQNGFVAGRNGLINLVTIRIVINV